MVTAKDIFERYHKTEIDKVTTDITFNIYTDGYLKEYHWYKINKVGDSTDFTVIGSPNNDVGTRFQCNTSLVMPVWDGGEIQSGKKVNEYIEEYIDNARIDLAGYALLAGKGVSEDNLYQKEFLVVQTMALLCQEAGLTDKAQRLKEDALNALYPIFGGVIYDSLVPDKNPPPRAVACAIKNTDWAKFDKEMGW